jgi:ABC-type uncharacterized transport system ATPase subunit
VALVTGDRRRLGLMLDKPIWENIGQIRSVGLAADGPLVRSAVLRRRARAQVAGLRIRSRSVDQAAGALSGGNQQKVVLAREIDGDPKVLIAAQPTRGLDVGAIEFVHGRLIEQRDAGRAIFLVSLELEEILSLSDRILVIYEGQIAGEFPPTATEEELGFAMTGGRREGAAA